ncbi:MAG: VCBS repeat-containing protein, partial [Flavobacteriales bacterium]|nr:VCBS repeat-containing protein [Flavobacteriales bacterium]
MTRFTPFKLGLPAILVALISIFTCSNARAQWLDFTEETDSRLVLTSVANSDEEEKDHWAADFNNDGWTDLIVVRKEPFSNSTQPEKSDLLLINNNGVLEDQTATYAPEFISSPTYARDVFAGDFDGDGWLDVVVANTFGQQPKYYRNQGEDGGGNWLGFIDESASRFPLLTEDTPLICAVWGGDLTGDGDLDLYFVNYKVNSGGGTAKDFLLINDGNGFFTNESQARLGDLRNSAFGTAGQIHDIDNDGDNDIIKVSTLYNVAPWNARGTIILFNDGTGNFTNWQNLTPSSSPYMFDIADFNQDGMLDIYIVDDGFDYVYTTTSITPDVGITFTSQTMSFSSVGGFGGNVHVADIDLDGDLDVGIADVDVDIPPCNSGRRMAIFRNDGGTFTDPYGTTLYDWADNCYDFAWLDVNNDGLLDFVTGDCAGHSVHMSTNCDLIASSADYDLDGIPDACDPCPTNPDPGCAPDVEYPIVGLDHSVARQWNDMLLESIRRDFARPTVHARNLFHTSVVMWDAWAAFDDESCQFLLGETVGGFSCAFDGIAPPANVDAARDTAITYAAYRLLSHRFANSPQAALLQQAYDVHMADQGMDISFTSQDYSTGSAAALGNYIAQCMIDFGLQDGSNEGAGYTNTSYAPINPPLIVDLPGNPDIADMNRWQPLTLDLFIDQSGNEIPGSTPDFLSPEWGQVVPFALDPADMNTYTRDGFDYQVYHDPGSPPTIQMDGGGNSQYYQWGYATDIIWSSHLDATDGVMWDVSPASIGNRPTLPASFTDYDTFYHQLDGGTLGDGHAINPATGAPYAPHLVPRADYARVLAEFWADGPDSETPPGHWFTIFNYVSDHPDVVKQYKGEGAVLPDLEWDVKGYLAMGGAMHDAAVTAWGIKGWYDYIRPVSAIRAMADLGQSTDPLGTSYHPAGLPLVPGYIEVVETGDPLAGTGNENVGKIKVFAWKGHNAINNVDIDEAGVDWILAETWEPYQRPSFVTPPFAGFVSGHSTYSRAAAEVLTMFTGDEFFPGGMGTFLAPQNEFLVFEDGPSVDVELQWATYRDAADESGLSRIWGGIHPPADDIPGRIMGIDIGIAAFNKAESYFTDSDYDGLCDYSDAPCLADLNNDGIRNIEDLMIFLGVYGCMGPDCVGDL